MSLGGVDDRLPARLPAANEEAPHGLKIGARLIIPLGIALSCIAHLALLTPAVYLGAHPFDPAPADAITVDIVSADEAEQAPKADDTAAGTADKANTADKDAADAKTAAAPVAAGPAPPAEPQPQPPQPQPRSRPAATALQQGSTQPAATQVQPAEPQIQPATPAVPVPPWLSQFTPSAPPVDAARESDAADKFAMPLALPGGRIGYEYQGVAAEKPDVSDDVLTAFRKQFKACAPALPAAVTDKARVTLRIDLNPDGTLVKSPENPRAVGQVYGVSVGSGDLFLVAKAVVLKCQPYKMLPPDKYAEWKTLDVPFTRDNF